MKKIYAVFAVLLVAGFATVTLLKKDKKTGWIDVNEVYNGFKLKKELEASLEAARAEHKKMLDSLEFDIILLSKSSLTKSTAEVLEVKKQNYMKRKRYFDQEDETLADKYQAQILTQINQYVKDYGEKNDFEYIYGTDGSGSLMYAKEANNLTNDVKVFINNKYDGIHH